MDTTNLLSKIRKSSPIIDKKGTLTLENTPVDLELSLKDDTLKDNEIESAYAFYKLYSNIEDIKKPVFLSERMKDLDGVHSADNIKIEPSNKGSKENSGLIDSIISAYKSKTNKFAIKPHDIENKKQLDTLFEDKENKTNFLHLITINDFLSGKKSEELYSIFQTINLTLLQKKKFGYPTVSSYYNIIEEKYPDAIELISEEPLPIGIMDGVLNNQDVNGFISLMNSTLKTKIKKLPVPPQIKDPNKEKLISDANKAIGNQLAMAFKNGGLTGLLKSGTNLVMNKIGNALSESESINTVALLMENISISDDTDFTTFKSKQELIDLLKTDHEKEAERIEKDFMEKVVPTITNEYLKKALTSYSLQDDNNFLFNLFNTLSRKMYLANPDKGEVLYEWDDKVDNVFSERCPAFQKFLNQEDSLRQLDEDDLSEKEEWVIEHPDYQEALDNFGDSSILYARQFYDENGNLLTLEQLLEKGYDTKDYTLGSDIEKSKDADAIMELWQQLAEHSGDANILSNADFHDENGNLLTLEQLVEKGYNVEDYTLGSDIQTSPDKEKIEKFWSQLPETKDELKDEHVLRIKDVTNENKKLLTAEQLAEKGYNTKEYRLSKEICNSDIYNDVLAQWKNLEKLMATKKLEKNSNQQENGDNIESTEATESDNSEIAQESITFIADLMKHRLI